MCVHYVGEWKKVIETFQEVYGFGDVVGVCVYVRNGDFTDGYQSDMIIYVWDGPLTSPSKRHDWVTNRGPSESVVREDMGLTVPWTLKVIQSFGKF